MTIMRGLDDNVCRLECIVLRASTIVLLLSIMAGSAWVWNARCAQHAFQELRAPAAPAATAESSDETTATHLITPNGIIDKEYVTLWKMNHDIVGWLHVPNTSIDYPVMQKPGEETYYLRRDFNGKWSLAGTPFLSSKSSVSDSTGDWEAAATDNLLIYGHNMHDGTMFHQLMKYKEEAYCREHPCFQFDSIYEGGHGVYRVIAAVVTVLGGEDGFDYEKYADINTSNRWHEYVEEMKARSLYQINAAIPEGAPIVSLSTCEYSRADGRFCLVGVRVQ